MRQRIYKVTNFTLSKPRALTQAPTDNSSHFQGRALGLTNGATVYHLHARNRAITGLEFESHMCNL